MDGMPLPYQTVAREETVDAEKRQTALDDVEVGGYD